jgi:hypothetical protein
MRSVCKLHLEQLGYGDSWDVGKSHFQKDERNHAIA